MMRRFLTMLSFGTGVAVAAPARADIPPDPDSVHAHCSPAEQCPTGGMRCEYAWRPGGKDDGESAKVGLACRVEAEAKGLEERCRDGGNYSGHTLYCPKGATGSWSPKGTTPAPVAAPVEPVAVKPETKPETKTETKPETKPEVKPETKTEVEKSGCSVDGEGRSGWLWLGVLAVVGLRRRRG